MKLFAGYIRVSTAKQGEKGVSLQEQRSAIEAYAARSQLTVSQWFEERVTAAKKGRPVFNEMLVTLRKRLIEGVIIHKIDRSARNLKDWADLGELIDSGVEIHFAGDSLDLNTRGGRLSADIQAVVAADYIRNLKEEARKGLYGRLKQGIYPLRAPLGYLDCGGGKVKVMDPTTGPLVRKAFELYATGGYTLEALSNELNRCGLRTKTGGEIGVTRLSDTLNNPFYTGIIRIKRTGETFSGIHEPLITQRLYDQVQRALRRNGNGRVLSHGFLFSRLFTCASCGRHLIAERQKGHVYYRCHRKSCPATCVREETLQDSVLSTLRQLSLTERQKRIIDAEIRAMQDGSEAQREEQLRVLTLNLAQVKDRLKRLTTAYLDQTFDRETFQEHQPELLKEKLRIEESLAAASSTEGGELDLIRKMVELACTALQTYLSGNHEEKRRIVEILVSNREVHRKSVSTRLSFPFDVLGNEKSFRNVDIIGTGVELCKLWEN